MRFVACLAMAVLVGAVPGAAQSIVPSQTSLHLTDVVRSSISQHPVVQIQEQQVEVSRGRKQQASSVFDEIIEADVNRARVYTPFGTAAGINLSPVSTAQLGASISKLLRNGLAVTGAVDVERTVVSAAIPDGLTTSHVGVALTVPFLRGRGRQVTTAGETVASLELDSSVLDLRHLAATLMTRAVSSYWSLVAAERNLEVLTASATRGDLLVENVRAMINGDQMPRSDLASALANLADRQAARVAGEQAVIDARQQLILDAGIGPNAFPERGTLDQFPPLAPIPDADLPRLTTAALERRADYVAARIRAQSARVALEAAKNGLLPELNLSLNAGYSGLSAGREFDRYLVGLGAGIQGPDVVGRVSYQFPVRNNLALGRLADAQAQSRQAELRLADLTRSISTSVIAEYGALRNAALRLERARESVDAFQTALQGERDKLSLGIGSIVNLLTIEDRLTAASENSVGAWSGYAQALVQFRFATGSLVPLRDPLPVVDESTFTTVPSALLTGAIR
jgi:outer membrane protein